MRILKRKRMGIIKWFRDLWRTPQVQGLPNSDVLDQSDLLLLMLRTYDRLEKIGLHHHAVQMYDLLHDPRVLVLVEQAYLKGATEFRYNPDGYDELMEKLDLSEGEEQDA